MQCCHAESSRRICVGRMPKVLAGCEGGSHSVDVEHGTTCRRRRRKAKNCASFLILLYELQLATRDGRLWPNPLGIAGG